MHNIELAAYTDLHDEVSDLLEDPQVRLPSDFRRRLVRCVEGSNAARRQSGRKLGQEGPVPVSPARSAMNVKKYVIEGLDSGVSTDELPLNAIFELTTEDVARIRELAAFVVSRSLKIVVVHDAGTTYGDAENGEIKDPYHGHNQHLYVTATHFWMGACLPAVSEVEVTFEGIEIASLEEDFGPPTVHGDAIDLLLEASARGEANGGSMDWDDIGRALDVARLERPGSYERFLAAAEAGDRDDDDAASVPRSPPGAAPSEPGAPSTVEETLRYPRVLVLCSNSNGVPEFHSCIPKVTQHEYDNGEHYELAKANAEFNGFGGPMIAFDASDEAATQLGDLLTWIN